MFDIIVDLFVTTAGIQNKLKFLSIEIQWYVIQHFILCSQSACHVKLTAAYFELVYQDCDCNNQFTTGGG